MPGATNRPPASIVRSAAPVTRPISTIVPSLTATSARKREKPLPSTTIPFLITRSCAMASSPGGLDRESPSHLPRNATSGYPFASEAVREKHRRQEKGNADGHRSLGLRREDVVRPSHTTTTSYI